MFLNIVVCDAAKENIHSQGKESVLCLFTVNPDTTVCHTPKTLNVLIEYLSFFSLFLQGNTDTIGSRSHPSKLVIYIY
jgi:hypothetical protein